MRENSTVEAVEDVELEDAQEWGDTADDSGTPSEIPASAAMPVLFMLGSSESNKDSIPEELRELILTSDVRLLRCENAWNVEGWAAKLRKCSSVTFTIDEYYERGHS